jgi:hypothetical protein
MTCASPPLRVHVASATLAVTIQGQPGTTAKALEDALRYAAQEWRERVEKEKRAANCGDPPALNRYSR